MAARIIETLSLLTLLGVVALRPLVSESYDSSGNPFRESIATIEDPHVIRRILSHLRLPTDIPHPHPSRPPPLSPGLFDDTPA